MVDLESPILAQVHLLPLITAQVNVVPEKSVSIDGSTVYIIYINIYKRIIKKRDDKHIYSIYLFLNTSQHFSFTFSNTFC